MTGQVFCSTVINNVCTMFEGPLECGTHHGIIYDNEGIGTALLDILCDTGQVDDFEEGVRRRLEEDHGDIILWMEEGGESGRVGRIDVVYGDALVGLEV